MSYKKSKPSSRKNASRAGNQTESLDTRLLGQAIIELNIARKNFAIYPPGHIQIAHSIDRAWELLTRLIASWPALVLGIARDRMFVDEEQLDTRNSIYREFATALHSQNIAAVSFIDGLTKAEVLDFLAIITSSPEAINERGGIGQAMKKARIEHINVEAIDYASFFLTEEEEILQTEPKDRQRSGTDLWQEFISNLTTGQLARKGQEAGPKRLSRVDPAELARFLNSRKLDPALAIQSYEKVFAGKRRGITRRRPDARLNSLLQNLQPELKQQFLSITFDHVAKGSEELLDSFTDNIVFEMLQRANEQKKEISPTLVSLLEKLAGTAGEVPLHAEMSEISSSELASNGFEEHLRKLLERESYENYVDSSYNLLLQRLSGGNPREEQGQQGSPSEVSRIGENDPLEMDSNDPSIPDSYSDELEDRYLDLQISNVILALIEQDLPVEDYAGFSRKLVAGAGDLLDIGESDLVATILRTLRHHVQEKPAAIQPLALECLQKLGKSDFVSKALNTLRTGSKAQILTASQLLSTVGDSCIPEVMRLYAEEESSDGRTALLNLLKSFGKGALDEAYRRLADGQVQVLRNLLIYIENAGDRESIVHLRPLLNHESLSVRLEALTTLLKFEDPEGPAFLRDALHSRIPQEVSHAVLLSGHYRVADAVTDLLDLLKKSPWRALEFRRNEEIIRALGKIGDPRALPLLAKLAKKSLTLYPSYLRNMKVTLFESLSGYPRESLAQLLKIGKQSAHYWIRNICEKLSAGK
jgi:HEAT repeat protein